MESSSRYAGAAMLVAVAVSVPVNAVEAQQDSTPVRLDTVLVTVTRITGRSVLGSPYAVTIVRPDSARPGQRHSSIEETLAFIPGLSAISRNNPAQDARLSIRGFGARSAFGVRGVRVLRDGMPLTLPDGQTPLDYLSLESVGRIEVMRGAASALYGNASGGVIDIRSAAPSSSPLSLEARQWIGSRNTLRTGAALTGTSGNAHYLLDVAHNSSDGERAHSRHRATTGLFRSGIASRGTAFSIIALALHSPLAENPGALTGEEMGANRSMADPLSLRRNARKSVRQVQIGVSGIRTTSAGDLTLSAFGGARSLDNPLTFTVVEIGRHTFGAGGAIRHAFGILGMQHKLAIGVDVQTQNDLRRNYAACADTVRSPVATANCPTPGEDRGIVTLDQRELVAGIGLYASDEVELSKQLLLTAGLRGDRVRFEVRDRLVKPGNPDDSGIRLLGAVSPIAGLVSRFAPSHSAYANLSAAFETPTATELGNRADGSGGINSDINPQRSRTVEAGVRGYSGSVLRYDAAVFHTIVRDELIPFEIANSSGRRFFRNAGRTLRRGAELGGDATVGPAALLVSYSYSRFTFDSYAVGATSFAGNAIPGIPRHRLQAALRLQRRGRFTVFETETTGSSFADDANAVRVPGHFVAHLRAGLTPSRGAQHFTLTAGVSNIFDDTYSASIVANAARARFFEPAPGRSLYVGASLGRRLVK